MTRLTAEERRLLEQEQQATTPTRRRQAADTEDAPEADAAPEHLRRTPVQYGDDGWGDLPVQMRGE